VVRFLPIYDMILAAQEHFNDKGIALISAALKKFWPEKGLK